MRLFAALYAELDASTSTHAKVDALRRYLAAAAPADAAWAVYFLAGGKPRQVVPTGVLRALACRLAGIDDWLFEACYQAVGDLAETIAHVLPPARSGSALGLAEWVEQRLLPLRGAAPEEQAARVAGYWDELDATGRFLLTKLIGGGFRVGVSKLLVQRALAEHAGVDPKIVAQRMMGYTDARSFPDASRYIALTAGGAEGPVEAGQPYPFFLAHPLEVALDDFDARLLAPSDWLVEWKYDGIRAQVVKRAGSVWIWSRGEELVTERFPEIVALAAALPDGTVLDGEIVVWKNGAPATFSLLQQRIGRKTLTRKVLADAPVGYIAYDLLEWAGTDVRERPQHERRALLERLLEAAPPGASRIELSPLQSGAAWHELATLREQSRARGVEGFMLKHRQARYGTGRRKQDDLDAGTWWKWKIDPHQRRRGAGLRAGRPRPPRQRLHRLHLRRLEPRAARRRRSRRGRRRDRAPRAVASRSAPARAVREGLLGPDRRGVPRDRPRDPPPHAREIRPGAQRQADARVRARLRRHQPQHAPQERHRRALPADAAHPPRQAAARGRHAADARSAAGVAVP